MKLLFLGDVVGKPGRRAVRSVLPGIIGREDIAFVVANCENVAGGAGVDPSSAEELLGAGVDVLTSGNHIWRKKEVVSYISAERRGILLRPANFPPETPGVGWTVRETAGVTRIAVLNLIGRVFMDSVDCPFQAAQRIVPELRAQSDVVFVDMHAEATSEKGAMGWMLDGQVAAVLGSHTHVQTADERILPAGTAYLTDAGMCGPTESVIGVRRELVIHRFLTHMPAKFDTAGGPAIVQGAVVDIDESTGLARSVRRVQEHVE
jgi:metallophosphoesterase (TIGR00282 family)